LNFNYYKDSSLQLAGLNYTQLKEKYPLIAQEFEDYILDVASVVTDDPSQINELFVRLNQGKPLTEAEIRTAMRGAIPKLIDKISKHKFFKESVRFSILRAQHKDVAAKLLLLEFRGKIVNMGGNKITRFVNEGLRSSTTNFRIASDVVMDVLNIMYQIFAHQDELLSNPKRVPLYYWFIRSHSEIVDIRRFFEYFELERAWSKKRIKTNSLLFDQELLEFSLIEAEDSDSSEGLARRYQIMEEMYVHFQQSSMKD
jgi:hypothetical protein